MGRRDQPELTPPDADLAAAEAATRQLLAAHGEPAPLEPPPGLAARVVASLPQSRAARAQRPWWAALRPALAYAAVLALALVGMSALAAATGLSSVAVPPESALGRIGTAFAATPLGELLAGGGVALGVVALVAGAWLWWRVRRRGGGDEGP